MFPVQEVGLEYSDFLKVANKQFKPSLAVFYTGTIQDEQESIKEGRPIFKDVPFIRIQVPGDRDVFDQPAWIDHRHTNSHNNRFPEAWAAYKNNQAELTQGTPLAALTWLSKSRIEEFKYLGIRNVEDLASLSDANAQKIMGIKADIQKAKDYLEQAKGNAPLVAMRSELEKRDSQMAVLERTVQQLQQQLTQAQSSQVQVIQGAPPARDERLEAIEKLVAQMSRLPAPEAVVTPEQVPAPKRRGRPAKTPTPEGT